MITNVTSGTRDGRRADPDRRWDVDGRPGAQLATTRGRDRGPGYTRHPCRVASSIARLEEVERHLAVVRARTAGDGSRV